MVYSTFKTKYDYRNLDLVEAQSLREITAMSIVKAAAVQIAPVLYSREGTVEKVVNKIRELGEKGV